MAILYKYLTRAGARAMLKYKKFLLSPPFLFNDPFDARQRGSWSPSHPTDKLQSMFRVLSLTRSPFNSLMWTHYGDEHKGVVVGVDTDMIPEFRSGQATLTVDEGSVIYVRTRPTPTHSKRDLLYKSESFSYEEEVRLAFLPHILPHFPKEYHTSIGDAFKVELAFDPACVAEIYLGCNFLEGCRQYARSEDGRVSGTIPDKDIDEYFDEICTWQDECPNAKLTKLTLCDHTWGLVPIPFDEYHDELARWDEIRNRASNDDPDC